MPRSRKSGVFAATQLITDGNHWYFCLYCFFFYALFWFWYVIRITIYWSVYGKTSSASLLINIPESWRTNNLPSISNNNIWISRILLRKSIDDFWLPSSVREITKSSSTFSATNISSNEVWLLQLYDTIQMESIFCYQIQLHLSRTRRKTFVNLQRAKNGTHMFCVKYRYVSAVLISSNRTLGIIPH